KDPPTLGHVLLHVAVDLIAWHRKTRICFRLSQTWNFFLLLARPIRRASHSTMLTLPRIPIQYPNRSLADNNYLLGRSIVHLTFSRNRLRSWRFDGCSTCGTRGLRYGL